jgi:hypothetical protein
MSETSRDLEPTASARGSFLFSFCDKKKKRAGYYDQILSTKYIIIHTNMGYTLMAYAASISDIEECVGCKEEDFASEKKIDLSYLDKYGDELTTRQQAHRQIRKWCMEPTVPPKMQAQVWLRL